LGPGPVFVDAQVLASAGAGETGGDVQDPVTERRWFAAGEVTVEAEGLGPGEQVGGGEGEFEPDLVLGVAVAGYLEPLGGCP